MDICDFIEQTIGGICPVYAPTPDFSGGDTPEKYVIYSITEKGGEYSEGAANSREYLVSLNCFTADYDYTLYAKIELAMQRAGASYIGGGNSGNDVNFPYVRQYYLDFCVAF